GATFENMLHHAEQLGANAIVGADYSNSPPEEVRFHGTAVVVERIPKGGRALTQPLLPLS
ncbi:MAG: heavy metal-binding domain-containing protein, partial [Acidobacteria bacterium]|nr:heavy metal-binding domain-containing protein [Acidobacteriota bacterium]